MDLHAAVDLNSIACTDKRSPRCMGRIMPYGGTVCSPCQEQRKDDAIEVARAKVLAGPQRPGNIIHWDTMRADAIERGSYGDTVTQSVIVTIAIDPADVPLRFDRAVRRKFPFRPEFCTYQHKLAHSVAQTIAAGRFLVSWQTYHSMGD